MTSIIIDYDDKIVIYIGTSLGGVWKTEDGRRNWIATSDYAPSLGIEALTIDLKNKNILYAGTGEGNEWHEKESLGIIHPIRYYAT